VTVRSTLQKSRKNVKVREMTDRHQTEGYELVLLPLYVIVCKRVCSFDNMILTVWSTTTYVCVNIEKDVFSVC